MKVGWWVPLRGKFRENNLFNFWTLPLVNNKRKLKLLTNQYPSKRCYCQQVVFQSRYYCPSYFVGLHFINLTFLAVLWIFSCVLSSTQITCLLFGSPAQSCKSLVCQIWVKSCLCWASLVITFIVINNISKEYLKQKYIVRYNINKKNMKIFLLFEYFPVL